MNNTTASLVLGMMAAALGIVVISLSTAVSDDSRWTVFGMGGLLALAGLVTLLRFILRNRAQASSGSKDPGRQDAEGTRP